MQESRASQIAEPTPIFGAYRRGYDPEQVDRYVADQQRRLDDAQYRASEAERKLAAAIGQLRELHRRVGVLEQHQQRPSQAVRLDGVGERIQRIFEEARDGAEALRQETESDLAVLRHKTIDEARSIVAGARNKAEEIESETERKRREELDRLEEERARSATQLTFLHEQRKNAVAELLRIREVIDSTIAEVSADLRPGSASMRERAAAPIRTIGKSHPETLLISAESTEIEDSPFVFVATDLSDDSLHRVDEIDPSERRGMETARLVRAHRERVSTSPHPRARTRRVNNAPHRVGAVFDYDDT